ncbi:hypothetical protein GGR73_000668 [Xanthomonas sp. F14]
MKARLLLLALLGICAHADAAPSGEDQKTTRVVVLGVDHAAQLIAPNDSPAILTAFLRRVKPDAICIERSPEAFARNDYYEFTYEVQDVIVPFARSNGIDLCPIDWEPPTDDARLGFGMDLDAVPEVRPVTGFQQFLVFNQPSQLTRTLFHADDPKNVAKVTQWAATPTNKTKDDLPRRLYLYRTFLQAKRLAAAAKAHVGGTVLLVVGEFHKRDIEAILADEVGIEIIQPSSLGAPTREESIAAERSDYWFAIASFNLLGIQSTTGNIDFAFVRRAVAELRRLHDTPETALLTTRLDLLEKRIRPQDAIKRYRSIAASAGDRPFSWTGVLDPTRVDSYFDPFGNVEVGQRALIEAARELSSLGDHREVEYIHDQIAPKLEPLKGRQFETYWKRYIAGPVATESAVN